MQLRVAACQILTYPDVKQSAEKIAEWIRKASDQNIDVVAFPEASLCGYPCTAEYWKKATPEEFAAGEERIIDLSRELGIAVVLGTVHWEKGAIFNSILAIEKGGRVRGRYAKTHLAESWSRPGRSIPVYSLAGFRSSFLICHDIRYPELVRLPAVAGAQICYFCSNESGLLEEHKLSAYRAMPIARATENGIFLVMANAPGNADDLHSKSQSHGNSKIIHPDGNVLTEAGHFEETLVTCSVDMDEASRAIAERSVNDETILKEWMQSGADLVTGQDYVSSGET
jgi:predicted amidohydrolase